MSEFQYYEFQALERPLTAGEQQELRRLSSRAEITSRRLTNEYHYSSFRGDVKEVLEKYFDAFLYRANWGTNRLMFRLPRAAADPEAMRPYFRGKSNTLKVTDKHVILDLNSNLEGGEGWIEGEGMLDPLLPIREQLLAGDLRALYLAWLGSLTDSYGSPDEDEEDRLLEPPVPPGLNKLDSALEALAEFLRVDSDLLAAAARASGDRKTSEASEERLSTWLESKPAETLQRWLVKLLFDGEGVVRRQILAEWRNAQPRPAASEEPRRTVAQLRELARRVEEERKKRAAEAQAKERKRKEQERAKHLDGLVGQEEKLWGEAEQLIQTKRASEYGQAVTVLADLRDLAERRGTREAFQARMHELAARHKNKPALLRRFQEARLLT